MFKQQATGLEIHFIRSPQCGECIRGEGEGVWGDQLEALHSCGQDIKAAQYWLQEMTATKRF